MLAVLAALSAQGPSSQSCAPVPAAVAVDSGWKAYRAGALEAAARRFGVADSLCPRGAAAQVGLGFVGLRQGRVAEAERRLVRSRSRSGAARRAGSGGARAAGGAASRARLRRGGGPATRPRRGLRGGARPGPAIRGPAHSGPRCRRTFRSPDRRGVAPLLREGREPGRGSPGPLPVSIPA